MADPADSDNVIFLSNWDGTDGDTSYTPEVGAAATWNGGELSDTHTLFGNTTLFLDAASDEYLVWADQATCQGLVDKVESWTVEGWFYVTSLSHTNNIFCTRDSDIGWQMTIQTSGAVRLRWQRDSGVDIADAITSGGEVTANTWTYIKATFNQVKDRVRIYVAGALEGNDDTLSTAGTPVNTNTGLYIGMWSGIWGGESFEGYMGPMRVTVGEALEDTDVPAGPFEDGSISGVISLPSMLAAPAVVALNDFGSLITDIREFYVMEVTGSETLRLPISSWQATVQADRSSFLQCVIPAATDYVDELDSRAGAGEEFIVYRATVIGGVEQKTELARAAMDDISYDRGPTRATLTLRGYTESFDKDDAGDRTVVLADIRSLSTTLTTTRARAAVDWFLRPGHTADADGTEFEVSYINYYATVNDDGTQFSSYMDVGTR